MKLAASIVLDGVAYSMVLFMMSIGLAMTMGLMRVVNMAHVCFAMIGGYLTATLPRLLGLGFEASVVLALAATALVALPIERFLIRRYYRRPPLDQMLVTIGLIFLFVATADLLFGATTVTMPLPSYMSGTVDLGFRLVPTHRLYVIALGAIVSLLLWFAVERSSFGLRVRAAVDNPGIAEAVGIDTMLIYGLAFSLGAVLAALGGIAGAEIMPMEPTYPERYLLVILAVVAVGGHGTLFGSFVAALLLGLVDTTAKYLLPDMSSIAFYLTMFAVLVVRPQGLFGHEH